MKLTEKNIQDPVSPLGHPQVLPVGSWLAGITSLGHLCSEGRVTPTVPFRGGVS